MPVGGPPILWDGVPGESEVTISLLACPRGGDAVAYVVFRTVSAVSSPRRSAYGSVAGLTVLTVPTLEGF